MTITVTMLQTRRGEDGNQWTVGNSYSASDDFAAKLISSNYATGTLPVDRDLVPIMGQTNSAGQVTSLVSGDGNVLLVIPAVGSPSDLLTTPLQHVNITAAISTTATQAAAATGTYYKARVAWNNNGASGTAKLRIAVNCDNDVHGLMVGQSSKRRDYEMTMGDAVILVCSVPITRLTFSADGSITGGTHQLQVTFGN